MRSTAPAPWLRTLCVVSGALLFPACFGPFPRSSEGFQCDASHACSPGLLCEHAVCREPDPQPVQPWRLATYLGTYPEAWSAGTPQTPTLGRYASVDAAVISEHLAALKYGHFSAGLFSWDGPGSASDQALKAALTQSPGSGFHWAVWAQQALDSPVDATVAGTTLTALSKLALAESSFLRFAGRPVVFIDSPDSADPCAVAAAWIPASRAQSPPLYLVVRATRTAAAYTVCADIPDAWYQVASGGSVARGDSYSISPGFQLAGKPATIARELAGWSAQTQAMVGSGVKLELVTSFNDWARGTEVEGAAEWASDSGYGAYLDVLHAAP